MNIAMQKVLGASLNSGVFNNSSFSKKVKQCIADNNSFRFVSSVKRIPACWKRFKSEIVAAVEQSGVPTSFITLSCSNLRRSEFFEIMQNLNKTDFGTSNLSYN